jgi:acyl carrier protein
MNKIILSKVKLLVAEHFGIDRDQVSLEANFRDTLNADSLDLIELSVAVIRYLEVDIVDCEMKGITTVGELVNYVERHGALSQANGAQVNHVDHGQKPLSET